MKKQIKHIIIAAAVGASLFFSVASSSAIVLDFANLTDLSFLGNGTANGSGQFEFTSDAGGYQFNITSSGPSDGLQGYITDTDLFTIGTITGAAPVQSAPVNGTAMLYITDQNNVNLTASVQWQGISTAYNISFLNYTGAVNLVDIEYTGNNSDLQALAAAGQATDVISFTSDESLSQLSDTLTDTSYSGSITTAPVNPVPEPGMLSLTGMGTAIWGLLSFNRSRRRQI